MSARIAEKTRKTTETEISIKLNIDGTGESKINSSIGFLDHMLELFAFWGHFDLEIATNSADLKVDIHHANEDLGIVLGQVFKEALGDKMGIKRIGSATVPMESVVASVIVDISGRDHCLIDVDKTIFDSKRRIQVLLDAKNKKDEYSLEYATHFLEALSKQLGMNLNIKIENPSMDLHTTLEPVFKALGKALDEATQIDPRRKGIPSTKGVID
ncbi:MAG: imidazoleglycerol-phosphate dehydratase [Candidatus Omnitrophica bacterium]|jgi:imidazoleglycerol-phosphate dehydratase|nr:imidazoleglycerol-phosphate dehydratase [Candidatus Omnitrophota bacterium]